MVTGGGADMSLERVMVVAKVMLGKWMEAASWEWRKGRRDNEIRATCMCLASVLLSEPSVQGL